MAVLRTAVVATDSGADAPRLTVAQLVAVAPLVAVFAGTLAVVGGWIAGADPFWPIVDLTLSEAVLTKDAGEVVRLLEREGVDANRRWPVREELMNPPASVTPLEAAVMIRRSEIIPLLLRHGTVIPEGEDRVALICLAVRSAADEIGEFLVKTGNGPDPRSGCPSPPPSH